MCIDLLSWLSFGIFVFIINSVGQSHRYGVEFDWFLRFDKIVIALCHTEKFKHCIIAKQLNATSLKKDSKRE